MAFSVPPPCFLSSRLPGEISPPPPPCLSLEQHTPEKNPDGTEAVFGVSHAGWLGAEGGCCVVSLHLKSCRRQRPCGVQSGVGHCESFPSPNPFFFLLMGLVVASISLPFAAAKGGRWAPAQAKNCFVFPVGFPVSQEHGKRFGLQYLEILLFSCILIEKATTTST